MSDIPEEIMNVDEENKEKADESNSYFDVKFKIIETDENQRLIPQNNESDQEPPLMIQEIHNKENNESHQEPPSMIQEIHNNENNEGNQNFNSNQFNSPVNASEYAGQNRLSNLLINNQKDNPEITNSNNCFPGNSTQSGNDHNPNLNKNNQGKSDAQILSECNDKQEDEKKNESDDLNPVSGTSPQTENASGMNNPIKGSGNKGEISAQNSNNDINDAEMETNNNNENNNPINKFNGFQTKENNFMNQQNYNNNSSNYNNPILSNNMSLNNQTPNQNNNIGNYYGMSDKIIENQSNKLNNSKKEQH